MRQIFGVISIALGLGVAVGACTPTAPLESPPLVDSAPKVSKDDAAPLTELQRIEQAIDLIEKNYYEEISRRTLSEACLSALGEPPPASADPDAAKMAIATALERSRTEGAGEEDVRGYEQCLRGVVSTLNRYSTYFSVREIRAMQVGSPLNGGIGVELAAADQGARVISTFKNTPGERAGLRKGEILIRIDDNELKGMPLPEIVRLLRGKPNSTVRVTLLGSELAEPRTVTIYREVIQRELVHTHLIEPGVALVRVNQFDVRAPKGIGDGLADAQLRSGGPLTGVVLDLRASEGGLLNVSVAIAAAFLPENALIVYTTGRTADSSIRLYSRPEHYVRPGEEDPYTRLPAEAKSARMVVLVSKTTAAGAEVVAAALQDHKRATIVGTDTLGKGLVELFQPLEGGDALKLSFASMFRPSGNALEGAGVTPDVIIPVSPETEWDLGLEEAVRVLHAR